MSWILAPLIMLIGVILVPILLVLSRGKPAAIFPPQALGVKSEEPQQKIVAASNAVRAAHPIIGIIRYSIG
jgi:hypothetical protein